MAEIIRSWKCLNARCDTQFESWEANPECPSCGCVRVQWVPGGGHVAGTAAACDAEIRQLAMNFGMTNMNSAERGRGAKQVSSAPPPPQGPPIHFGPGFSAPFSPTPVCMPSQSNVDFKAKVTIGSKLAPNKTYPSIRTGTVVEATHKG